MPLTLNLDVLADELREALGAERSGALEERSLCLLAATGLHLAYADSAVVVEPAPDRAPHAFGVLDVFVVPLGPRAPIEVRVVVHDELARGLWHEAIEIIDDAVRAAIVARNENEEGNAT